MAVEVHRKLFTVNDYERMLESGILSEDDRVELVEGEIIEMAAKGSRHAACVKRITDLFYRYARQSAIISVQDPIRISANSELEPDVALLRLREDLYANSHPEGDDVLLIAEVSDTSVGYDRSVKLGLYARANIPEVWIVNLPGDVIEIYSQPEGSKYQVSKKVMRGDSITAQSVAGLTLDVSDIMR
jgi:Uma2 family endonuclease